MKIGIPGSIILYLFVFSISIALAGYYEKRLGIPQKNLKQRDRKTLAAVLIIALPLIVLAAIRGDSVGVDTKEYARFYLHFGKMYPNVFEYFYYRGEDLFFSFISVFAYQTTRSVCFFFGILQAMVCVPVFYAIAKQKKGVSLSKTVAVYCFCFFNESLNAMRQYAALGMVFLFVGLYLEGKTKKSLIPLLIAMGTHFSSVLVGPVVLIVNSILKKDKTKIKRICVLGASGLSIVLSKKIFEFLYTTGVMPHRYILYLNTFIYGNSEDGSSGWTELNMRTYLLIVIKLAICVFVFLNERKFRKSEIGENSENFAFLFYLGAFVFVFGVIIWHTSYVKRISIYLESTLLYLLPALDDFAHTKFKLNKIKTPIYSVFLCFCYWLLYIVVLGESATIPYEIRV